MLQNNLIKLGFTKNEVKVYLSLFTLGKCKAGKIIEETQLHRNLVYTALEKLELRQLITKVISKGVAHFSANSPNSLLEEIETQRNTAKQVATELESLTTSDERDIKIYEGLEGIKQARMKVLDLPKGSDFHVMGASKLSQSPELESFWKSFHRKRELKGINQKMLFERTSDKKTLDTVKWRNGLKHVEARFLPFQIDAPFWFDFAHDHLNLGFAGKDPLTISIKSKELVDGFKSYFEYFWEQNVYTRVGHEAFEESLYDMLDELEPGEEYHVIGTTGKQLDEDKNLEDFYNKFHKDRIERGISVKLLCYNEAFNNIQKRFERLDPEKKLSHLKIFTAASASPMQICLFKKKTLIIIYEEEPTIIFFEKPEIYEGFKNQFDNTWDQRIKVYPGKEGIKQVIREILEYGDYDAIGGAEQITTVLGIKFFRWWQNEKKRRGIKTRVIMGSHHRKTPSVTDAHAEFKFLPDHQAPGVSIIFKDKVVNLALEGEPAGFIIKSESLAKTNQQYFDELWNKETHIVKGLDAVQDIFEEILSAGEVATIGARGYFVDYRPAYIKDWEKRAEKSGLKIRNIVDPDTRGHKITKFKFVETKYTLQKEFANLSVIWIFNEKVCITNWTEKEPIAIILNNKHIYKMYKEQFELLWNK